MSLTIYRRRRRPWLRALRADLVELAGVVAALLAIALLAHFAGLTFHL